MAVKSTPKPRRRPPVVAPAPMPAPLPLPAAAVAVPAPAVTVVATAPLHLPRPSGWWGRLALLLAFVEPTAGLLLALLYWRFDEPAVRRFSRWCLALAVLGALLGLAFGAAKTGLDGGEWLIQPY